MRGWLVPRESPYSFGKLDADRRVLERTGQRLARAGHEVITVEPRELQDRPDAPHFVLSMSQGCQTLRALQHLAECGSLVLNSPQSVWTACQRNTMLGALQRAGIPVPSNRLVPTPTRGLAVAAPVWVKRPDYHRLREDDVSYAATAADVESIFGRFAAAGIGAAVVQAHCPGQVVKCYLVGTDVIHVTPAADTRLARLRDVSVAAGRALGLRIFGVDLVIGSGPPVVIDVNDWPSFSPCCDEAATAIARLVDAGGGGQQC